MVELATELPSDPLTATEIQDLRTCQSISSVIELPSSAEFHQGATSKATVLVDGTVFCLAFDTESQQWTQTALAHDADRHQLLEESLHQLDRDE
jgi:hypothetical protein